MAEYCWQCSEEHLGTDGEQNDFRGLCKEGELIGVLCEGCGLTAVRHDGQCVGYCDKDLHRAPAGCLFVWQDWKETKDGISRDM
jgi:hypothetical protein